MFQPSPAVASRCNSPCQRMGEKRQNVSTLTGCCQPVQRGGGRVHRTFLCEFQPSPAVASRCNGRPHQDGLAGPVSTLTGCCQPVQRRHRAVAPYISRVSTLTGCCQPVQLRPAHRSLLPWQGFNPHRLLPAGATGAELSLFYGKFVFQPSPAVASRCNARLVCRACVHRLVSTLTGCCQPVQQSVCEAIWAAAVPGRAGVRE